MNDRNLQNIQIRSCGKTTYKELDQRKMNQIISILNRGNDVEVKGKPNGEIAVYEVSKRKAR